MTTKEQVIELAKQAGVPFNKYGLIGCDACECDIDDELERFATLVRNQALEDAATEFAGAKTQSGEDIAAAIRNMKDNT